MAGIKSGNKSSTGGGGGSITGFQLDSVSQTTAYASGAVTLGLSQVPFSQAGMIVNINGQILKQGTDWTLAGTTITFLVANPYLTVSDPPDIFTCQYPY
jgi:hypothetical protein